MSGRTTLLYVVCSPRRCVGKTLLSRLLAEFYAIDGRPVAAFDLSDEGPQLADYLPDVTSVADIGDTGGQMAFFDRLIAVQAGAKIIDLSHRAFGNFFTIVREIGFFEEARRRAIEPVLLFVVDPDPKSAEAFAMLRRWFSEASLLPVRNHIVAGAIAHDEVPATARTFPLSLEMSELGLSLRALIDRPSFSFARFWQSAATELPPASAEELRAWAESVFLQFWHVELSLAREETLADLAVLHGSPPGTLRRLRRRDDRVPSPQYRARPGVEPPLAGRRPIETPKQVLDYAPKQRPRMDGDAADLSGRAIVAMLQKAAELSNEDCERARTEADELSYQLRAAEDRINQLENAVENFQDRAVRAETWLQLIQREIEQSLIAPTAPARPKSTN